MDFMLGNAKEKTDHNLLLNGYKNLNRNEEIVIVNDKKEFVVNMPIELAKRMQQVLQNNYQFYAGFDNYLTGKEMDSFEQTPQELCRGGRS